MVSVIIVIAGGIAVLLAIKLLGRKKQVSNSNRCIVE